MDEKHGHYLEDLEVEMTGIYAKTVTEADIGPKLGRPPLGSALTVTLKI